MADIKGRIFSVMRRRDDLPEMTLPLAVLFIVGVVFISTVGALLASSDESTLYFAQENIIGVIACLPFLPLAACLYALIILLWRRFASLLATPIMFAVMLVFGADLFTAAAISVSMLLVSYIYATSLIARENRFRRLTSLSVAVAVCLVFTVIAWIGLNFDSFSAFTDAYMDEIPTLIGQVYSSYVGDSGAAAQIPEFYLTKMARDLLLMSPAYIGILSIALAWFMDFLACAAFRALDCVDVFIEITNKITMPFSYAVVYAAVFLLSLATGADNNPMLYVMLKSVMYVMLLPCSAVGVSEIMRSLEDKLYYLTREKLLSALILVFAFMFFGISPFLLVTSVVGAGLVIKSKLLKHDGNKKQ